MITNLLRLIIVVFYVLLRLIQTYSIVMEDYVVIGRIGEGAHGVVMKGRHKQSSKIVALKKVLLKRLEDGIPATALREIKALQVCYY